MLYLMFVQIILVPVAVSVPTVYDQRQNGNSNVRIDVRDAVLIAVADEFGDYDYTYDYSDLTIKPEGSTTSKPVAVQSTKPPESHSSTGKPAEPSSTSEGSVAEHNTTIIIDNSTLTFVTKPVNETSGAEVAQSPPPSEPLSGQDYQIPVIVLHDTKESMKLLPVKMVEKAATAGRANLTERYPQPRLCSPGFFLDNHNRCKRIRKPLRENVQ